MKKKMKYSVQLKLSVKGEVLNGHCECVGGRGPAGSCKHITAVYLMLEKFKNTGRLDIVSSGTERLQVFHHPSKRHTGIGITCLC